MPAMRLHNTAEILISSTGAIEDFNNALRLNPNAAEAYVSRGEVRYVTQYSKDPNKDYKAAIEDLTRR